MQPCCIVCVWVRRPACNKCPAAVDMFVYIVAQQKSQLAASASTCTCNQHGEPCTPQTSIVVFTYAYRTAVTCTASVRVPCYDVNDNLTGEGTRSSTCPDIEVNVAMFTIWFPLWCACWVRTTVRAASQADSEVQEIPDTQVCV